MRASRTAVHASRSRTAVEIPAAISGGPARAASAVHRRARRGGGGPRAPAADASPRPRARPALARSAAAPRSASRPPTDRRPAGARAGARRTLGAPAPRGCARRAPVRACTLDRRHPLGDGRPHERVTEAREPVGEAVGRRERRGLARGLGSSPRGRRRRRGRSRRRAPRRPPPAGRRGTERGDAPRHAPADAVRPDALGPSGSPRPGAARSRELGQHLLHEQRVAAGRAVARAYERRRPAPAEPFAPPAPRSPSSLERRRHRAAGPDRERARRALHAPRPAAGARPPAPPAARRGAAPGRRGSAGSARRPLEVVDREQQRPLRRRGWRRASTARAARRSAPRPPRAGRHRPGQPDGRRRERGRAVQQSGVARDRALEERAHDAEAEVALELAARGAEDADARRLGELRRVSSSRVLPIPPHPRRPRARRGRPRRVDERVQQRRLALALEQRVSRRQRHPRRATGGARSPPERCPRTG